MGRKGRLGVMKMETPPLELILLCPPMVRLFLLLHEDHLTLFLGLWRNRSIYRVS